MPIWNDNGSWGENGAISHYYYSGLAVLTLSVSTTTQEKKEKKPYTFIQLICHFSIIKFAD